MNISKKKWSIYGAIAAAIIVASFATPAIADDGQKTPAQLRAEADRIEMEQSRSRMTRELIKEIMADADARTMMNSK